MFGFVRESRFNALMRRVNWLELSLKGLERLVTRLDVIDQAVARDSKTPPLPQVLSGDAAFPILCRNPAHR